MLPNIQIYQIKNNVLKISNYIKYDIKDKIKNQLKFKMLKQ